MKWKFKKDIEVNMDEFWYDLTDGGYIKPVEILADIEQVKQLEAAIATVHSFEQALNDLFPEE